jgi:hypothetical protein
VILAAALIGAFTFFGGDGGSNGTHIDTTPQPPPMADEQQVKDTVENYFAASDKAYAIPDPAYPLLEVYATGAQLDADVAAISKLKDQGQATQTPPNSIKEDRVTVLLVNGDRARVEVCSISDGIVVDANTRQPAYDYPPGSSSTTQFTADLVREFGTWKVSVLTREQRWEGVAGCAGGQAS